MSSAEKTGLFVRIPRAQAESLDQLSTQTGRAKQHLVSSILADALDSPDTTEPAQHAAAPDVLDIDEVANLLRLDQTAVIDRLRMGDLPGRCFDGEWRFSKRAVLGWLGEPEKPRRQAGFTDTET